MQIKTILAAILLTATALLTSCNTNKILSKEKEILKERGQRTGKLDFTKRFEVNGQSHKLDSGWITDSVVLEIIPIGPVRYSPSDGFEGEALRIELRETKQNKYLKAHDKEKDIKEDLTFLLKKKDMQERSLQRKGKDMKVQRSMTKPLTLVIVLILLVTLSLLLFRKWRG